MDRLGRIPPVALLLLLFMGDSLQTPVNAQELSVTSGWLALHLMIGVGSFPLRAKSAMELCGSAMMTMRSL